MVLSIPATKTASKPRSEALINGTAEICITSTSLAMSAGSARTDDMEIISTSNPSFAKPPVSFAIHIDAMVPDVNKYAIRNGRVVAARVSLATAIASVTAKNIDTKHHGDLIVFFIAKKVVDLGKKWKHNRPTAHTRSRYRARFITTLRSIATRKSSLFLSVRSDEFERFKRFQPRGCFERLELSNRREE